MRKISALIFFLSTLLGFAQSIDLEKDSTKQVLADLLRREMLLARIDTIHTDSLEALEKNVVVIDYPIASDIDKKWLAAWNNNFLSDLPDLPIDIDSSNVVIDDLPTELLKERLNTLNSKTPFNVEYNASLEKVIKHYLKNRKQTLANLMGRAKYYFPIFEEHLDKYNIPLEIKYLAIVESALKPTIKSRVGATGLWQFMYSTGKIYKLDVSSYVDERNDPIKSTEAACKYLSNLYSIFGDWDLALAAYNSGPGNVTKAIRRSGGKTNYWNIRPYLPRETAGYLPAFYATYYIFEYAEEHQLYATNELPNSFETDTIRVKRQITFDQINRILKTDNELLEFLNPQYKLKIIPFEEKENHTLRLPRYLAGTFVANEDLIYTYAEADDAKREKPLPANLTTPDRIRYKVRSGDYLGKISSRYGVPVSSIKRWNGLKSNNLRVGQYLTIYPKNGSVTNTVTPKSTNSTTATAAVKEETNKKYTTYTVKNGDSLWLISQKFPNVTVKQLKEWNNFWSDKSLKPGTKLKIY